MSDPNVLAARAEAAIATHHRPCDYCAKTIVWTRTVNSTALPVDADPVEDGNVLVTDCAAGLNATVLGKPADRRAYRAAGWALRTHHKLTCPYADDWSRPGGPKRGRNRNAPAPVRRGGGRPARQPR